MNEFLTSLVPALANHVWQSSIFLGTAWMLTILLRKSPARVRHGIWLIASIKFLIPFSLLTALGNFLPQPKHLVAPAVYITVEKIERPFPHQLRTPVLLVPHPRTVREQVVANLLPVLMGVWLTGAIATLAIWALRWRRVYRCLHRAMIALDGRELRILRRLEDCVKNHLHGPLCIRLVSERTEPGIHGILRPVLLWPAQLSQRLNEDEIEAIMIHELVHVRRFDNAAAALHMLTEAIFWFDPLVWWLERRMIEERERACDEAVIELGANAEAYAGSVLKTCRFCVESPLSGVLGVTGADLKKRVVRIVSERQVKNLGLGHGILLATAAVITILAPAVIGDFRLAQTAVLASSQDDLHSQKESSLAFEVASIRPTGFQAPDGEGGSRSVIEYTTDSLTLRNIDVGEMIQWAYGLEHYQIFGEHVLQGQRYDVHAKASEPAKVSTLRLMLQDLLTTRFKVQLHWEQKRTAVYELVVDRGGAKLPENKSDMHLPSYPKESYPRVVDGSFVFANVSLPEFADQLADLRGIGLPVIDRTGIQGIYDITLKSAARAILESDETTLPTLIQKQLGLKLVSAKDPVRVLVVDHVAKPSAN